jgi:hypothetical protein
MDTRWVNIGALIPFACPCPFEIFFIKISLAHIACIIGFPSQRCCPLVQSNLGCSFFFVVIENLEKG